ncbi:MAG: hypothetical protein KDD44_08230 [Bdellovibrionales bacterium]|nr:hypothetical protein [Bdellovibrionales bacterium]
MIHAVLKIPAQVRGIVWSALMMGGLGLTVAVSAGMAFSFQASRQALPGGSTVNHATLVYQTLGLFIVVWSGWLIGGIGVGLGRRWGWIWILALAIGMTMLAAVGLYWTTQFRWAVFLGLSVLLPLAMFRPEVVAYCRAGELEPSSIANRVFIVLLLHVAIAAVVVNGWRGVFSGGGLVPMAVPSASP